MLEEQDLKAIAALIAESEKRTAEHLVEIDKRLDRIDERFDEINRRLNEVDKRIEEVNRKFKSIDQQFIESDRQFKKVNIHLRRLDKGFKFLVKQIRELKEMDENILEEIVSVHNRLDKRIDLVDNKVMEIQEYYRLHRLGDDNAALLIRMHKELEKRVQVLERV